ncbi:glucosaminidase domain-containing protein, partial [Patescibacteria group bacterium]|nr:glucosaminidase domain-containing protein [Patescibacteria group bacterium]
NGTNCTLCWTHEDYHGKWVKIQAYFQDYDSIESAFLAHAFLLSKNPRYAKAMAVKNNPEAFAAALTGVYATDPDYGNKLITIMRQSKLEQYDV